MPSEVKYEEQKHCCTSCAMKRRCHVCDQPTTLACSDCAIDLRAVIYVCNKTQCRDEHEKKCAHSLQSQLDALTWTEITPENLPKKVSIGKDWNGLVTNGRVVFRARLYVSSYNALSEERVLKWSGLEAHIGNDIHFEAITHYMELPNPPPPSGAKGETKP